MGLLTKAALALGLWGSWRYLARPSPWSGEAHVGDLGQYTAVLPARSAYIAQTLLGTASARALDPFLWWAVVDLESRSGEALTPRGPGGTGDFYPRAWTDRLGQLSGVRQGRAYVGMQLGDGSTWRGEEIANAAIPTARGWAHGLSQLDWNAHMEWLQANDWRDPQRNLARGADELGDNFRFFASRSSITVSGKTYGGDAGVVGYPDPRPLSGEPLARAAVAAYNAGRWRILKALAKGESLESKTYRTDYLEKILGPAAEKRTAYNVAGRV